MRGIFGRLRTRLTYANVMASAAVFIALGGTSYAALSIGSADVRNNSLRSADIRNNTLQSRDVRNNALTSSDIRNNTLRSSDIRNGSLLATDFKAGQLPAGAQGPKGDTGASGATTRWLLLDENGDITEQSGGFVVISKPGINGQPAANPNVYISTGATLVGKGLGATTAIQNLIDRTGDATPDPAFTGDVAVGRCASAGVINCVPTGTNLDSVLVVRTLADNTDVTSQTRRVYVTVTS